MLAHALRSATRPAPARPGALALEAQTAAALVEGGDARIALDAAGVNAYGCPPRPDAGLVALGSSTASAISAPGWRAANALHARLLERPERWRNELARLRQDLLDLAGAAPGTEAILAASGTDLHLIATQLAAPQAGDALQAVMAEPDETGRGTPTALAARHFGARTCRGQPVVAGQPVGSTAQLAPVGIALRLADGSARDADAVDADFAAQVRRVVASGRRCLLVLTDLSKTGLLAPSPGCAANLKQRFGARLEVLVDACQFRLAPTTLRGYVEQGFIVAITGSKFVAGPAFCGALLMSPETARRARLAPLQALRGYSARSEWPAAWPTAAALDDSVNRGLLLRWEAALADLRRFRAVPAAFTERFLKAWGQAVAERIRADPAFEPLPVPAIDRAGLARSWDGVQTIFPFTVHRATADGRRLALTRDETALLHRQLRLGEGDETADAAAPRFLLGQPVPCGTRGGVPVSALRLCASARCVGDAAGAPGGTRYAIRQALAALDRLAALARALGRETP